MKCAKIIVKSNYEKRGDLVLRSYIRALKKLGVNFLLENDNAIIYGAVDETGKFYELFSNIIIDYDGYVDITKEEYDELSRFVANTSLDEMNVLRDIMKKVLFNYDIDFNCEISTIEELAKDRAVEFDAYDKFLSVINPYQRLTDDNIDSFNDYNNFERKIEAIKKIRKNDSNSIEDDEYEVLENPKKLIRK